MVAELIPIMPIKMKTLVIHPKDITTDFLCRIYADKNWTVINSDISTRLLKRSIKIHERIIMLGHGTPSGLLGYNKYVIDHSFVSLLRNKKCVFIWCNANWFVLRFKLKGLYTGMIISELGEAMLHNLPWHGIQESNILFADTLKVALNENNMIEKILTKYKSKTNPIILFNQNNIFEHS